MTSYHHPIYPPTDCSVALSADLSPHCDPPCHTNVLVLSTLYFRPGAGSLDYTPQLIGLSHCPSGNILLAEHAYFLVLLGTSQCLSLTRMSTLYFRQGASHTTWFPGLQPTANRAVTLPQWEYVELRSHASESSSHHPPPTLLSLHQPNPPAHILRSSLRKTHQFHS